MSSVDLIWVCLSAFGGSMAGMIYSLRTVAKIFKNKFETDPGIEKLEITVVMNDEDSTHRH